VVGDFNNTSKIFDFNFKLYQAVNGMDALNTIEVKRIYQLKKLLFDYL